VTAGLRSLLFVPGGRADMIAKVGRASADAVVLDLEDAVAAADKDAARATVVKALETLEVRDGTLVLVRVNVPGGPWFDADLAAVRANVNKSTEVGRTVATDFTGALVSAGLLEIDPQTAKRLNYFDVAARLEELRAKYQGDRQSVHIIGFAKAIGDIRDGARGVIVFFGVAFVVARFESRGAASSVIS